MDHLVRDFSVDEQTINELTPVPKASNNVCPICHTWKPENFTWCENCQEIRDLLRVEPIEVSLISLYSKPSRLRDWLTRYKGRPGDEDPWDQHAEDVIESLLSRFFGEYLSQLRETMDPIEGIVVVPSTDRVPPHPLALIVGRLELDIPLLDVLNRTSEPIGFRRPNAEAYEASPTVAGKSLLLIDDVYTTGAHLNSAAVALQRSSAHIAGAVVIARRLNPHYREEVRRFWESARRVPFNWDSGPYIAGSDNE